MNIVSNLRIFVTFLVGDMGIIMYLCGKFI